jgi:hypothetical protein
VEHFWIWTISSKLTDWKCLSNRRNRKSYFHQKSFQCRWLQNQDFSLWATITKKGLWLRLQNMNCIRFQVRNLRLYTGRIARAGIQPVRLKVWRKSTASVVKRVPQQNLSRQQQRLRSEHEMRFQRVINKFFHLLFFS